MNVEPLNQAMEQALAANEVSAFRRAGGTFADADRWMQANVVHVMASCPDVLEYWLINASPTTKAVQLYRYMNYTPPKWRATLPPHVADKMAMHCISEGLDGIGDDKKLLALEGKSTARLERMLGNFLKDDEQNWAWLSPAWVGAPGTPLRAYANGHGWLPGQLLGQVAKSLDQEKSPSWAAWVAYPQCLRIIQRQTQVRFQQRQNMDIQTLKKNKSGLGRPH